MKKMLHKGFNPSKCKTSLKMAVSRLKLLRNKKEIQLTQLKREVAQLLQTGQDQTARIRVEHVVREEKTITAYELIDLYCELIVARLPIIETQKNCPIDLKEAIASVIFASPRCSDIPELIDIKKHFTAKYGKDFVTAAIELRPDSGVNRTLIEKLSAVAPDGPTKVKILTGIAEENKIKWEPDWFKDNVPEPPAYVPNVLNIDKISKMNVEPQTVQAGPRFEPKPDVPSNIHHVVEPKINDTRFAYSAAGPSGAEYETVEPNRSYGGVENSSFVSRQKWNVEFKDASAAAHAAAESAEMANMAARAAAEIASRGKFTNHESADSNFVQNEGFRVHAARTNQGDFAEKSSADNSFREKPSRMERIQGELNFNVKTSGMMDENSFKKEYHHAAEYDRPKFSEESNSPRKTVQKDGNQPNAGKRSSNEFNPYADHKQSSERYYEVQDDEEIEEQHDSLPEDSEFWRSTSGGQVASKYEYGIFSDSNRGHDDGSVDHPLYGKAVETRNQSGLSENYGSMPSSDPPKFDDDLDENPFDSNRRDILFKEDLEREEPYKEYAFDSNFSQDQKDVLEQRKYAFDSQNSHKNLFSEGGDDRIHTEKGSPHTTINAAPQFDDYVADEDYCIQSPGRKSPDYSSPDEERLPKKSGILSSKHLYQPELSESFKNSPIYSQLVKPISLGDDSDEASSENDEEVKNSARNIFEESTAVHHSEEILEEDSGDLLTRQKSPGSTRSRRSDAKNYDRRSFSRLLDEAERLSSPRRSSLQATKPEVIDEFQDNYQSNPESSIELNVESLSGGLKNKGLRLPPYTKDTSAYSSSSSISTLDNAPKVRESSTFFSDEIKEPLGQKESTHKKTTSSLLGTDFDPNSDPPLEDADWKGSFSIQNSSDKKFLDKLDERSSPKVSRSYIESEDVRSGDEGVKHTVPSKYNSGAGFSRRTRASGAQTETKSSYKTFSATESVSEKDTSSSKAKTESVIQMESSEPRRREQNKTRPSQLSKMSSGEEISSPSVAAKQATISKPSESRSSYKTFSTTESVSEKDESLSKPKTKSVIQMESLEPRRRDQNKTKPSDLSKTSSGEETSSPSVSKADSSMTSRTSSQSSHVHPKLPDYDDFASHFLSIKKNRQ